MEKNCIDPILWDVAKFVVDNHDASINRIIRQFDIGDKHANNLIEYLSLVDVVDIVRFKANKFNDEQLWNRISLLNFWNNKRTEIEEIFHGVDILFEGRIVNAHAKIGGYNCSLYIIACNSELVGTLYVHPKKNSQNEILPEESRIPALLREQFMRYFELEEKYSLGKTFSIDYYDCAFDWYKKVLTKFVELDETKK